MAAAFPSPAHAVNAVVVCLGPLSDRVHTGSLNSGRTLPCCPTSLLRVETNGAQPAMGTALLGKHGCHDLVVNIVVTYTDCFQVHTKDGKSRSLDDLSADGMTMMLSWWRAYRLLRCCTPDQRDDVDDRFNQRLRFVSVSETGVEGQCAGWVMNLEADITMCDCDELVDLGS